MKREIAAEGFTAAAPCAPYGIWEDPSRRTRAARLRGVGSLSSAAPADGYDGAPSPITRPLRARAFLQKA